jgi:hypothetical protein
MSKHNRERRRRRQLEKIVILHPNHPEYSAETLRRLAALQGQPGKNQVAIFHEQFCADALRRGAKKCMCNPEIKVLDPEHLDSERDRRAYKSHWINQPIEE